MKLFPLALAAAFVSPVLAQNSNDAPKADVPEVATEIVIEDLSVSIKRLRIGVALSPEQIKGLTDVLEGSGAKVTVTETTGGAGED